MLLSASIGRFDLYYDDVVDCTENLYSPFISIRIVALSFVLSASTVFWQC